MARVVVRVMGMVREMVAMVTTPTPTQLPERDNSALGFNAKKDVKSVRQRTVTGPVTAGQYRIKVRMQLRRSSNKRRYVESVFDLLMPLTSLPATNISTGPLVR